MNSGKNPSQSKRTIIHLLFLFFGTVLSLTAGAEITSVAHFADRADFYVSPDGNDAGPGTKDAPFLTISQAQKALRVKLNNSDKRNYIVLVRSGEYFIDQPLIFTPEDTPGDAQVIYASYPGENAVVHAGRQITGWKVNVQTGFWEADASAFKGNTGYFRDLYVNGRRAVRARQPNSGEYFPVIEAVNRTDTFKFRPDDIQKWPDWRNIELIFIHDWSISRSPIASIDLDNRRIETEYDIALDVEWLCLGRLPDEPFFLENSIAFLDQPGEWYLNKQTGKIVYVPRADETLENSVFIAPAETPLLQVNGRKDDYVQNLHFVNLDFRYSGWNLSEDHYLGIQACYYVESGDMNAPENLSHSSVPAAIEFNYAKYCGLSGLDIRHIGQTGVWFKNECHFNTIQNCRVSETGGNGIMVGLGHKDKGHWYENKPWWSVIPETASSYNTIKNNRTQRCAQSFWGGVGIWVGLSHHNQILHNHICDLPYTGISVGWMWGPGQTPCHHNVIAYNHIHDVMILLSDGAAVYTLGRQDGTQIRGNLIHGVAGTKARAPNNALRWDRGGSEMLVEYNFIYDIVNPMMHFNPDSSHNIIRKNVFFMSKPDMLATYRLITDEQKKTIEIYDNDLMISTDLPPSVHPMWQRVRNQAGPEWMSKQDLAQNGDCK